MLPKKGPKGRIAVLTGGGDVPGLNPAIRAVTYRAIREGFDVVGIKRGWAGLIELIRDPEADNSHAVIPLTKDMVEANARTGGTFLHSSRTRPSAVPAKDVPEHMKNQLRGRGQRPDHARCSPTSSSSGSTSWCRSAATTP